MPQLAKAAPEPITNNVQEHSSKILHQINNQLDSSRHDHLLFICYILIAIEFGFLENLHSSLFTDLAVQLNASEMETSILLLSRTVGYTLSTVIAAVVLDKFQKSHRYLAAVLVLGAMAKLVIPYTTSYPIQMALWFMIGSTHGTVDTCLPGTFIIL